MRRRWAALGTTGLLLAAALAACTEHHGRGAAAAGSGPGDLAYRGKVGVILPDTKSSARWATADPKYLKEAFAQAKVPAVIMNADGDKTRFLQLAADMVDGGVKVLMIVNLDSPTGRTALTRARAKGIPTVDYDRMTLGGRADYYVSFDNEQVGEYQGRGLVECLTARHYVNPVVAEVNGSPTDNNATQFKQGYDSVLQPLYDAGLYRKGPDQWVPDWTLPEVGPIFEQMLAQRPNINGVVAANDGVANEVIAVLRSHGLNGKVPVTGQDATIQGMQNIMTGDQCLTIYKAIRPEAQAAVTLAAALFRGQRPTRTVGPHKIDSIKDPETGAYEPYIRLEPVPIVADTIHKVVDDGYVTRQDLCAGRYAQLCAQNRIT
jgi:D-xylose transport system substrate-binding protein